MARLSERKTRADDVSGHTPPVGSIVAYMPGYFTGAANAGFTLTGPGSNDIAGANAYLPDNWRICDGTALNDPESPIWVGAGRHLPDLSDSRFIRGASSSGSAGGSNSKILNTPQLPSHGHPLTISDDSALHDHPGSSSTEDASHSHPATTGPDNAPHSHPGGAPNGLGDATHWHYTVRSGLTNEGTKHELSVSTDSIISTDIGSLNYALRHAPGRNANTAGTNSVNARHGHPTGSVPLADATHSHPTTVNVNNAPHSHTITVGSANAPHSHPGSSVGTTGAGDSFDIQPNYVNVFYIIRIK